jgi:hypothetical protein
MTVNFDRESSNEKALLLEQQSGSQHQEKNEDQDMTPSFAEIATRTMPIYMNFDDPINLTNNTRDSVYGQVAAYKNNVYIVWEEDTAADSTTTHNNELSTYSYTNYDIYFEKSTDGGVTFSKAINISNNPGFSQHPQIAVSGSNVYLAWTDDTSHNKEILFRASSDEGNSFGRTIKLNDDIGESYNQEISAYGNNVYVVWENKGGNTDYTRSASDTATIGMGNALSADSSVRDNNNRIILFKASTDGGNSFKNTKIITTNLGGGTAELYPKIAAAGNDVYLTWSVGMLTSRVEDEISDYDNNYNISNNNDGRNGYNTFRGKINTSNGILASL